MAQGQWVNIPGKGRRWQQPSGELMMEKPGLGFVQAQLAPVTSFLGGMFKSSGLPAYQMSGPGLQQARQKSLTGREKISKAWGMIGDAYDTGGFAYRTGNGRPYNQPSYTDAQGNIYDAVSGRLLYPAKNSSDAGIGSTGSGFSPAGSSAAERAYQAEKSRVAQLTAQDPEVQRYEKARAEAKTQEEMDAARDIGMKIWAQKNPGLAAKVKPGQSGYDVIQGSLAGQAAAQGYGYQLPEQIMMTPPPGVNVPQGLPNVSSFNPIGTYVAQGIEVDPEMAKKFQALLNQTKS